MNRYFKSLSLSSSLVEPLETRTLMAHIGLDLGFGSAGLADAPASGLVTDLPGGKIATVGGDHATVLKSDGTVDSSFHDAGAAAGRDAERAVVSGNRLIIAGRVGTGSDFFVRAIDLTTGAVDSSFGAGGITTFTAPPSTGKSTVRGAFISSLIATSDGGYVVSLFETLKTNSGGRAYSDFFFKFTSAGQLDSSFGNSGVLNFNSNFSNAAEARLAPLASGKFLVIRNTANSSVLIERRNNDGTVDTSFGTDGRADLHDNEVFPGYGVPVVDANGKILIAVNDNQDNGPLGYVMRRNADGSLDTSFGTGGKHSFGPGFVEDHLAIDSQGRILGTIDTTLFRLTSTGQLDTSFDDDGLLPTHFGGIPTNIDADASDAILIATSHDQIARFAPGPPVELDANGILRIDGSGLSEQIHASLSGTTLTITLDAQDFDLTVSSVKAVNVHANDGADLLDLAQITVPMIIDAGAGDDTVLGGSAADVIFGGDGNDNLAGNGGNDIIFGGQHNDSLAGGDGNDRLFGGTEDPSIIDEHYNDGDDSISGNAGNDRCDGMAGNDRVAGNGGRDRLFGGNGDDRIYGGASGDWLYGGDGADQLFGEGGTDRLYADDQELNHSTDTLHGNAGDDFLISRDSENDLLYGDGGHDSGYADANDVLTSIEVVQ